MATSRWVLSQIAAVVITSSDLFWNKVGHLRYGNARYSVCCAIVNKNLIIIVKHFLVHLGNSTAAEYYIRNVASLLAKLVAFLGNTGLGER